MLIQVNIVASTVVMIAAIGASLDSLIHGTSFYIRVRSSDQLHCRLSSPSH
ncbi:hypothetical protein LINGRAHAP2_LOCUS28173 [Linum grandiflorum]